MGNDLNEALEGLFQLNSETVTQSAVERQLRFLGEGLEQFDSVGIYLTRSVSKPGPGWLAGAGTITVLWDRETEGFTIYGSMEGSIGPIVSVPIPGVLNEYGVIGYQGRHDDYAGAFYGITGSAGTVAQWTRSLGTGDAAVISGLSPTLSAQILGGYTSEIEAPWEDKVHGRQVFPIGRVSSARLPAQVGLIEAGNELNALDVISEQRSWQPRRNEDVSRAGHHSGFFNGLGSWLFGDGRASPAAPRLGAPATAPPGSPGYPPSSAQRMRALH